MRWIALFILIFSSVTAEAASYYVNPRLQTQVRENFLNEREAPFNVFLDTGVHELPKEGTFDVSLLNNTIFSSPDDRNDEFDLYQAVYRMNKIGDTVDISVGRQFLSPGFTTYLIDGLSTTIGKSDWPVSVEIIGGIPRYIETGDFHGEVGILTGATIELQGFKNHYARLSVLYDKLDIKINDWDRNETVLVGLSTSHQFGGKLIPNLYGDFEYDTAGKVVDTGTAGLRLKPQKRIYCYIEGGYYNTNRDFRQPSILGLYATGAMYQGLGGLQIVAVEENRIFGEVAFNAGYAYQRFDSGPGDADNGNNVNAGVAFSILPLRLDSGITYSFYDSFGGRAHDILVALHDEPINRIALDAAFNYTKYTKVTNDNDDAVSAYFMAGFEIVKNLILSAGGEYLNDNVFKNDWRATAQLAYRLEGNL